MKPGVSHLLLSSHSLLSCEVQGISRKNIFNQKHCALYLPRKAFPSQVELLIGTCAGAIWSWEMGKFTGISHSIPLGLDRRRWGAFVIGRISTNRFYAKYFCGLFHYAKPLCGWGAVKLDVGSRRNVRHNLIVTHPSSLTQLTFAWNNVNSFSSFTLSWICLFIDRLLFTIRKQFVMRLLCCLVNTSWNTICSLIFHISFSSAFEHCSDSHDYLVSCLSPSQSSSFACFGNDSV